MAGNKISLADWQAQLKPQGSNTAVKTAVKDDANLVYSTDSGKISAKRRNGSESYNEDGDTEHDDTEDSYHSDDDANDGYGADDDSDEEGYDDQYDDIRFNGEKP